MTFDILWLFLGGVLGVIVASAVPHAFALLGRLLNLGVRELPPRAAPVEREPE